MCVLKLLQQFVISFRGRDLALLLVYWLNSIFLCPGYTVICHFFSISALVLENSEKAVRFDFRNGKVSSHKIRYLSSCLEPYLSLRHVG